MLDKKYIEQSSDIIRQMIKEGKIVKPKIGAADFFIRKSRNALIVSERLLRLYDEEKLDTNLWVINTAYYSMFFAATALLAKFGRRIDAELGIHRLTYHALVHYFIKEDNRLKMQLVEEYETAVEDAEKLLQLGEAKIKELVKDFNYELEKRKTFTYSTEETAERNKAITSYNRAKNFLQEISKIV